jgi:ribulose-5-phosphate 4-epimerase/fuculose-1-phosphate aldolase
LFFNSAVKIGKPFRKIPCDDIIIVDFSDENNKIAVVEGGKTSPSSETILHSMIYRNRKNINFSKSKNKYIFIIGEIAAVFSHKMHLLR